MSDKTPVVGTQADNDGPNMVDFELLTALMNAQETCNNLAKVLIDRGLLERHGDDMIDIVNAYGRVMDGIFAYIDGDPQR